MSILFSGILGLFILSSIIFREKNRNAIDFFFMASLVYLLIFSLVPIIFHVTRIIAGENPDENYLPFYSHSDHIYYTYSSIVALLGYIIMFFGYQLSSKFIHAKQQEYFNNDLSAGDKKLRNTLIFTIVFAAIGLLSFVVYLNSAGSWLETIKYSAYYRSNPIITKYSYMKNVAPFVVISSYFAFALTTYTKSPGAKFLSYLLFSASFSSSAIVLFHQAGRLNLFLYIMTFPAAYCLINKKGMKYLIAFGAVLFSFIIVLGKELFNIFIVNNSVFKKSDVVISDNNFFITEIINEFSFPMLNISNAVDVVPKIVPFRYFSDILTAVGSTIPNSWLPTLEMQQSISSVNTSFFATSGAVPVDLITFGYYSMGVPGVLIVMFCFGIILRFFDWCFPVCDDPLWAIFRVAWIFFLPIRIVYGDPSILLKVGFTLMIGTLTLFVFFPKSVVARVMED